MSQPISRHAKFPIPYGTQLRAKGWRQEGILRLLENVLSVGEDPENLVIYAALGKAARNWQSHDKIVQTLKTMAEDETLVIQSGKPIGLLKTHDRAPLVIMANCNIVGQWAKPEVFYELEKKGLIVWGGLTAGAWQYIGTQGVIQGTYEIFMRIAEQRFGGSLAGRFILTAGLGGMGGSQPLAGRMAGAAILCVDVDPERARKRQAIGYLDAVADNLDAALAMIAAAVKDKRATSVGLVGNAAEVYPEIFRRGIIPDIVTDQTSAHDLVYGYVPKGFSLAEVQALRKSDPQKLMAASTASIVEHVGAMLDFQHAGAEVFDNGNLIRTQAKNGGVQNAFDIKIFTEAYLRPLFARAIGPFRWMALSGEATDIARIDDLVLAMFPHNKIATNWINLARQHIPFEGLPARIAWLPRRAHRFGAGRQRAGAQGRAHRPHRVLARPSRRRRHGASDHHDRAHAGRFGRHRRLAAARRHAAHCLDGRPRGHPFGRWWLCRLHDLGRRHPDRGRHARRRRTDQPRAHQRHLARRHALRRCRLRRRP